MPLSPLYCDYLLSSYQQFANRKDFRFTMDLSSQEYSKRLRLHTPDVDFTGHMDPCTIFAAFQQIAEEHCLPLGLGYQDIQKRGVFWALVRMHLAVTRLPRREEEIVLRTWASPAKRILFPRYFTAVYPDGTPLFAASSIWTIVSFSQRKALTPQALGLHTDDFCSQRPAPVELPERLHFPFPEQQVTSRECTYSDLDINAHMNNAKYLNWICDALGYQTMARQYIEQIHIAYPSEIKPGARVKLGISRERNAFQIAAAGADGALHFTAAGTLASYPPAGQE